MPAVALINFKLLYTHVDSFQERLYRLYFRRAAFSKLSPVDVGLHKGLQYNDDYQVVLVVLCVKQEVHYNL